MNKPVFRASYSQGVSGYGRANAGLEMCDRCTEIDAALERYRRLTNGLTDQPTIDAIQNLSEQLKAEKVELHPEQQE